MAKAGSRRRERGEWGTNPMVVDRVKGDMRTEANSSPESGGRRGERRRLRVAEASFVRGWRKVKT